MNVTHLTRIATFAAVFAATAPAALAQADEGAQRSRADVKAETIAAMKAGELMPAGEAMPVLAQSPTSIKTRAERKAETLVARSKDELVHSGIATYRASISQQTATAKSTKTRAERKAETMDAARHGQLIPAGEAG